MDFKKMILPNKDFQTSVNIEFDFGSKNKVEQLIPTDSVCVYLEELLRDVITSSNQRAKLLVGPYGKGKSHVVLAALTAMWAKDPAPFKKIISAYKQHGLGFGDTLEKFVSEGSRLLPVVISGSTADLRHALLSSLRKSLSNTGLMECMPQTNYDGALNVLTRWQSDYPDTIRRFETLTGHSVSSIISRLKNMDTNAYELFVEFYPELTSGSSFDVVDGAEVLDVYDTVLNRLREAGISGIYIVYDEFSKYLETSIDRATVEDTKLLQDIAEACNRSSDSKQLHLLLISHKSISNYIDSSLPKDKVDGWRGVSGRFREIEMHDDEGQYFELLSNAIIKDKKLWGSWLDANAGANAALLELIGKRYVKQGLFKEEYYEMVTMGCFPLHPLTTYILARMSEKVAQNERTLFTFICSNEENSFINALESAGRFVSPDYVYSYFEPLLRREFYTSPLHRIYELAKTAIQKVEAGSLEERMIKTIAAIDVVAQYDKIAPTKEVITELYSDCGFDTDGIKAALDNLIASDSIVYLRRSNAFLKLKETSGVHIDREVSDRAESLRSQYECVELLNTMIEGKALYPSRYNEERGMVRFFNCKFIGLDEMQDGGVLTEKHTQNSDGAVLALHPNTPNDLEELKRCAKGVLSELPMTVAICPKKYVDVTAAVFLLQAAKELKAEAGEDEILAEEYEIVVDDYTEIVEDYIAGFFQPELGRSYYYIGGTRRNSLTRKRKLAEELSVLCEETYGNTPRITNEALNKNELTGTAFSSRTKILKSLCGKHLEPNFGFIGNGQETSMARSAFEKTGIIANFEKPEDSSRAAYTEGIEKMLQAIRGFIEGAQETPFSEIYNLLTGPQLKLGLRRGPIPLYLAYVMRDYRDEIVITHDGEERPLSESLLDDIARNPAEYYLTRLNWTPQMTNYIRNLASLFSCDPDAATRNEVADAIRLWYVELPQVTRNSRINHASSKGNANISKSRTALFNAVRSVGDDTSVFLFEKLPAAFGVKADSPKLVELIRKEKKECDGFLSQTLDRVAEDLTTLFDCAAHSDASLGSTLRDWVDRNPATTTHVFSGVRNQILNAIKDANGDDRTTVNRIAKAATSLRIDDWNDARFDDFFDIMRVMKSEVEGVNSREENETVEQTVSLVYAVGNGTIRKKTFDVVECSERSRLLKNSIFACLDEMGGALQPDEKRQIVFEVLEELC